MEKRNVCRLLISIIGSLGVASIVVGGFLFPSIQAPKVFSKESLEKFMLSGKAPVYKFKHAIIDTYIRQANEREPTQAGVNIHRARFLRESTDEQWNEWFRELQDEKPTQWKLVWGSVVEDVLDFVNNQVEKVHKSLKHSMFYRTSRKDGSWRLDDVLDNVSFLCRLTFIVHGVLFTVIASFGFFAVGCNNRCLLCFYLTVTIIVSIVFGVFGVLFVIDLETALRLVPRLSQHYDTFWNNLVALDTGFGFKLGEFPVETLAEFEGGSFSTIEGMVFWVLSLMMGQPRFIGCFWLGLSSSQLVAAFFGLIMMCTGKRDGSCCCCGRRRKHTASMALPSPATADHGVTKETTPLMSESVKYY